MGASAGPTLIGSVQRAFRLLEAVSAHENGAPAKQLARETGLPLATAYHLLRTLVHDGYLRKLDDGGFILGERLQTLHTAGRTQALLTRIRPTLAALRDELSTAAYLTFYEEGRSGSPRSSTGRTLPGSTSGWGSRTPGTRRRWASRC